jgi:hypothetical protein
MSFDILNIDEVDFNKIIFTENNNSSNKSFSMDYTYPSNNSGSLRIATPWVDLLSINETSCLLSLKVMSNEPKMQNIYEFIKNVDNYIITSSKKYKWFDSKDYSMIKYRKSFVKSTSIKEAEDDTQEGWIYPIIKCNVLNSETFNKNGEPLLYTDLKGNQKVKVALECCGIWFKDNKFGTTWRVLQFLLGSELIKETEYSFKESDDEDESTQLMYDSEFTDIDY